MSIYFEGTGNPSPVSVSQARDQLIIALKAKRDEVLTDKSLESYEDPAQRDRVVADNTIRGVLQVLDGETELFPYTNLCPAVPDEDIEEAKLAGADYFDPMAGTIGVGLAAYWDTVNN